MCYKCCTYKCLKINNVIIKKVVHVFHTLETFSNCYILFLTDSYVECLHITGIQGIFLKSIV